MTIDWSEQIEDLISNGFDDYADEYNLPVSGLQILIKTDTPEDCKPIYILKTYDKQLKQIKISDIAKITGAFGILKMFIQADTIDGVVDSYIAQFIQCIGLAETFEPIMIKEREDKKQEKLETQQDIEPQNVRLILTKEIVDGVAQLKSYLCKYADDKSQYVCELNLEMIMGVFKGQNQ